MINRIIKFPLQGTSSFFLFGPRGTGKTTWLRENATPSIYIDLLDAGTFSRLSTHPERLQELIPPSYANWVIIDEIQKIPDLLNEVHRLIETQKYRFILTGSSARNLRKRGVNLLAGRALTYSLFPLTALELNDHFSIQKSLSVGHLPMAYFHESPTKYLESYVQTYLKEEILYEGLARNLTQFYRFLETASFSQASQLNITQVARDAQLDRVTVSNYFTILEDLLVASRLPVFTKRAKRRMVTHEKFYFFDVGVFRTIRPQSYLDSPEEAQGAAFETLCFQELNAINNYLNHHYTLYYWRTANGQEVDFVLYGPRGLLAIEVKRSTRFNKTDLKSLKAFKTDYPESKQYLVYGGTTRFYLDEITILPIHHFLKELDTIL